MTVDSVGLENDQESYCSYITEESLLLSDLSTTANR